VSNLNPTTIEELLRCVDAHPKLQIIGAGTKTALRSTADCMTCSMTNLSGIVDHQPSEFLISALAGTPLTKMQEALAEHGQYLPFDPPFASCGATIGGTVATGLSGAGRLRYGGLRDFIVGIKVVDGLGQLVTGGGRVVKNAAGFDLPKLFVGSCGYFGAIVEVTLKVFPQPKQHRTVSLKLESFPAALRLQSQLSRSPIDLAAIDLTSDATLWLRMEGEAESIELTIQRIRTLIQQGEDRVSVQIVAESDQVWAPLDKGSFTEGQNRLVRVPLAPTQLLELERSLQELTVQRRYSVAGNVAWIDWPGIRPIQQLDECLRHHRLGGTVLTGKVPKCRIGVRPNQSMMKRVKAALDPENKFVGS
jgi:glycolate oxidase FAD binding subunit